MQKLDFSKLKWQRTNYGYSRKKVMEIDNRKGKTCKVQFVRVSKNSVIPPHHHKGQTESEYVLSGSGTLKSGKQIIKLRPGVLFVVGPNERHEVKSGGKGLLLFVTKANYSDDTEWRE